MKVSLPSRLCFAAALLLLPASVPAFARNPKPASQPPASGQSRSEQRAATRTQREGSPAAQNQHLKRWLDNHKNLPPAEQEHQLQSEPGFRELPQETQQRELERLRDLNNMPVQQRERMLDRTEMLEHMSPQQQQQYRGAAQQLRAAALPRQRLMAKAILDLRMMPLAQREQIIASPAFAAQFSDGERATIRTLLTAEPYAPAAARAPASAP